MTQRYFLFDNYQRTENQVVVTDLQIHHHLTKVLRASIGLKVALVFPDETSFLAKIIAIDHQRVFFNLISPESQVKELPIAVTIASAYPKADKLELITQKSTELGAQTILTFPSEFSNVNWDHNKRLKKEQRLNKIAQASAEQSGRTHLPEVKILAHFDQLLKLMAEYDLIIVAYEEEAKQGEVTKLAQLLSLLHQPSRQLKKIIAIFGSEGGFAKKEIASLVEHGAQLVGLGSRILRCETAPLYFLSVFGYELELRRNKIE